MEATSTRRRDSAATRGALLAAARTLMAQHGVEGTSTRDVAAAAGVNQALVYRYFGSKEKLFAEAASAEESLADELIMNAPLASLPRVLMNHILDLGEAEGAGEMSTLVAAANSSTVREIIRHRVEASFSTRLAQRLTGPDAALRAELFAGILVGVAFLRHKVGTATMSSADRETLCAYVEKMAASLLY